MARIGLLSDTHSTLPDGFVNFFNGCDEIWHAGDIGTLQVVRQIEKFKPLRAVFGNIDGRDLRLPYPLVNVFTIEELKVAMMHIGGYPGRYTNEAMEVIRKEQPGLFISGHSHILKIIYDKKNKLLYINPGAAGIFGIHQKITMVRFSITGKTIADVEVYEKDR